jgi:hypothetical protein
MREDRRATQRLGRWVQRVILGGVILAFLPVLAAMAAPAGQDARGPSEAASAEVRRTAVCTLSNPSYSGDCVERVGIPADGTAAQACRVVLDCLNDSRCPKTYCRSTTIRQGWKLESAKQEDSPAQ